MAGAFITFEGIDGCGKSTQLRILASELRVRRVEVVTTREPGGTSLGKKLRAALLDVDEQVDPLAELFVFAADRAQHVRQHLLPALAANKVVLSDRYADATAYPGQRIARTPRRGGDYARAGRNLARKKVARGVAGCG